MQSVKGDDDEHDGTANGFIRRRRTRYPYDRTDRAGFVERSTVHTGESGIHALELARELHPDVVLLDVMMPGLDGPATLTKMRSDPEIAHIPVIFITAKAMPQEVAQFREMGAVGVIAKPFDPMLLGQQLAGMWQDRVPEELPVDAKVDNEMPLDSANLHLHVARLGEKFLARSRHEAIVLRALSEHAHEGDPVVIDEIERMAHKIHGSGSMFGFPAVSAKAAEIERIIEGYLNPPSLTQSSMSMRLRYSV